MVERKKIERKLDKLRTFLQEDDADIELLSIDECNIKLRLLIGEKACKECILASDVLCKIFNTALQEVSEGRAVIIEDPRNS